jgi:hypothetical protein
MAHRVANSGLLVVTDAKYAECEQHVRAKVDAWKAGEGEESAVEMVAKINAYRSTFVETFGKPLPPQTVAHAPRPAPRSFTRPSRRRTVRRRQTSRSSRGSPARQSGGDDPPPHPEDLAARSRAVAAATGFAWVGDLAFQRLYLARERTV